MGSSLALSAFALGGSSLEIRQGFVFCRRRFCVACPLLAVALCRLRSLHGCASAQPQLARLACIGLFALSKLLLCLYQKKIRM